jgi:hypothetical protein
MRRREAGLGYWLAVGPDTGQLTLWERLRKNLLCQLKAGRMKPAARELPLDLNTAVLTFADFISAQRPICDGIGDLAVAEFHRGRDAHHGGVEDSNVRSIEPLQPENVKRVILPNDLPIRVKRQQWIRSAAIRSMHQEPLGSKTRVRFVPCFNELGPARSCSEWLTLSRTTVRTGTTRITELPQASRTVDLSEMREAEREGFLREAAALKGVLPGRGELLAVFRNVPIEVVSRLSFSKESRTIRYSVTLPPSLRRTRVHDLAAVRDMSSEEIHLVPHRTRYRTVFLN